MLIANCGGGGSTAEPESFDTTCEDYQIMLDVEVVLARECTASSQCTQVLGGTGCGCDTDDVIANSSFDANYLYDLLDESRAAGCTVSTGTSCACDAGAEPACVGGRCTWR
ncbi:MAG: hypothetical protein FJ102_04630 [Deltaproteobacteria bacterium]|nr:hypothetical protein [Deltaproteobacteria bacterium]